MKFMERVTRAEPCEQLEFYWPPNVQEDSLHITELRARNFDLQKETCPEIGHEIFRLSPEVEADALVHSR